MMPSRSSLAVAFMLVATMRALPVDEISARNGFDSATSGVGGQAAGGSVSAGESSCTSSGFNCLVSGLTSASVLKLGSGNAGNGGNALSGAADGKGLLSFIGGTDSMGKVPQGGFSGPGGEAPGGSVVDNHPALIELGSDNAGQGGDASSGNSSGLII